MNKSLIEALHDSHHRKLTEIRSRSRLFQQSEQRSQSGSHKGHYLKRCNAAAKAVQKLTIQHENFGLADRCRNIYSRKSQHSAITQPYEGILQQNKFRNNFFSRIFSENQGLLKRIVSQKSQYQFNPQQDKPSILHQSMMRERRRSKTLHGSQATIQKQEEIMPCIVDDYSLRQLIVHVGTTILDKMCMLEISRSQRFFYVTLDFMTLGVKYKLRLSQQAGERMLDMYECNPEVFARKRIIMERGEPRLVIIWGAFIRKYVFKRILQSTTELRKFVHQRTHTVMSGNFQRTSQKNSRLETLPNLPELQDSRDVYELFRRVGSPTISSHNSSPKQ